MDSISEDSSLQAEQSVELRRVLCFVGIVLASWVDYQQNICNYQSPNGSIEIQLQLAIEPLGYEVISNVLLVICETVLVVYWVSSLESRYKSQLPSQLPFQMLFVVVA